MLLKISIITLTKCGIVALATPVAEPVDSAVAEFKRTLAECKEPALPAGGGLVTSGSEFDREIAEAIAGKKNEVDSVALQTGKRALGLLRDSDRPQKEHQAWHC